MASAIANSPGSVAPCMTCSLDALPKPLCLQKSNVRSITLPTASNTAAWVFWTVSLRCSTSCSGSTPCLFSSVLSLMVFSPFVVVSDLGADRLQLGVEAEHQLVVEAEAGVENPVPLQLTQFGPQRIVVEGDAEILVVPSVERQVHRVVAVHRNPSVVDWH